MMMIGEGRYPMEVSELPYLARTYTVEPQLVLVLEMNRREFDRRKEEVLASPELIVNEDILESHWRMWNSGPSIDLPTYMLARFLGSARIMTVDARRATGALAWLAMRRCQDMVRRRRAAGL